MTNIIKVKFLKNGQPSGRDYTYYTPEPVEIGDTVDIDTDRGIAKGIDLHRRTGGRDRTLQGQSKDHRQEQSQVRALRILHPARRRSIHLQRQSGRPEGMADFKETPDTLWCEGKNYKEA